MLKNLLTINRKNPLPLYIQIKEILKKELLNKKPHEVIPTEREFASRFRVNQRTIQNSMHQLVKEGFVYRIKSRGTFINDRTSNNVNKVFIEYNRKKLSRKSRKPVIAFIYYDIFSKAHPALFFLLKGAEKVATLKNVDLRIIAIRGKCILNKQNSLLHSVITNKEIDGLIIFSPITYEDSKFLENSKIPFVLVANEIPGKFYYLVLWDRFHLTYIGIKHLIEHSCKNIFMIKGPAVRVLEPEILAYKKIVEENKLSANKIIECEFGEKSGYVATKNLLKKKKPDGIFFGEDLLAVGGYKAIKEAGLKVPKDIAVIGAGNFPVSSYLDPPLTSVDNNLFEIGEKGVEVLLKLINQEKDVPIRTLLPPKLIIRNSCGDKH